MPWSTEHIVSLARVLQRMALICRQQQPQLVAPIIKVSSTSFKALLSKHNDTGQAEHSESYEADGHGVE